MNKKVEFLFGLFLCILPLLKGPLPVDNLGNIVSYLTADQFYAIRSIFFMSFWIPLFVYYKYIITKDASLRHPFDDSEKIIIVYLFLTIVSDLLSEIVSIAVLGNFRKEGMIMTIGLVSIFILSKRMFKPSEKVLKAIFITSIIVSIYAIAQYFGLDFMKIDHSKIILPFSPGSTIGNANFLGSYIVLLLPIGMYFFIEKEEDMYAVWISVSFFALLCTRTRSAWLGMIVSFIIIIYFAYKRGKKKQLLTLFSYITLTLICFLIADPAKKELGSIVLRFQSILGELIPSFKPDNPIYKTGGSRRLFIWVKSLEIIKDYPFFGTGHGQYVYEFMFRNSEEIKATFDQFVNVDKAHNEYIQIAATSGIPALVFYISWTISVFITGFKKSMLTIKNHFNDPLQYFLFAAYTGYLVQAFFNISVIAVAPIFFIYAGLVAKKEEP